MKLVIISCALAIFLVVSALLSPLGREKDLKQQRLNDIQNGQSNEGRKNDTDRPDLKASIGNWFEKQQRSGRGSGKPAKKTKKDKETENMLSLAGLPISSGQFSLLKIFVADILLLLCLLINRQLELSSDNLLLLAAAALAGGLLIPTSIVKNIIAKKRESYLNELPDLLDLLAVSVEAGLGFDAAITRLYEKKKTPLMEEMMHAQRDMHHGISKKTAYNSMAERCGVKQLTVFLNSLIQAEELGVSMKTVLKVQSDTLRDDRRQRAEEKALKAPVSMLIPMVIFIFPVIFIVLLGPAVLNIMEIL